MFDHYTEDFGSYEKHLLVDTQNGHSLSFVPDYGCCLLDIQVAGTSFLDGYTTPIELDLNRWGKSGLLFPFPNRMAEGRYSWQGEHYNFPINDPATGTAVHGFGMDKKFRTLRINTDENVAAVSCQYEYDGKFPSYPFPFNLSIEFSLDQEGSFEMEYRCWNMGTTALPWGFGWHPYFQVGDHIQEAHLTTPELKMVGVDEQMIPTGKRYEFNEFAAGKQIGATVLDNCFVPLAESPTSLEIQLRGERGTLHYWQETGEEGMNYVQLFTPPYRKSLAIEPMSCNVDAFNNQDGLITLQPGDMARGRFGFRFAPSASS